MTQAPPKTGPQAPSLRLVGHELDTPRSTAATPLRPVMPARNARAAAAYRRHTRDAAPRSERLSSATRPGRQTHAAEGANRPAPTHTKPRVEPRWAFAARVAVAVDGPIPETRGLVPPETRDALMRSATHLGLRPFEATLIIAAIQDRARSGLPLLGPELDSTLRIIVPGNGAAGPDARYDLDSGRGARKAQGETGRRLGRLPHDASLFGAAPLATLAPALAAFALAGAGVWAAVVWITG